MGLGKKGEAYLVGYDFRMRSNSILNDTSSILGPPIETEQTRLWWYNNIKNVSPPVEKSEKVIIYNGRNGNRVLGMHKNLEIAGIRMAVIAEIPETEALQKPAIHAEVSSDSTLY